VTKHVRDNAAYFMEFIPDVGGERRAPKRAAALAAQAKQSNNVGRQATEKGQRAKFDQMLSEMGNTGVWGGSVEIQAFCQAYKRVVMVYSESGVQKFTRDGSTADDEEKGVVHVAYHVSPIPFPSIFLYPQLPTDEYAVLPTLLVGPQP
jgi:hypothetical protein